MRLSKKIKQSFLNQKKFQRKTGPKTVGDELYFSHEGRCPICENTVTFSSKSDWFRDHLICSACGSIPRERALIHTLNTFFPKFKEKRIHESSPGGRGASIKLKDEVEKYSSSHFFSHVAPGSIDAASGLRSENLENLTFEDESFDFLITQDVMEHVFEPKKAFNEIARVLKPGGSHVFTVPLINKSDPTECWASKSKDNEIIFHHKPEYHGNPIDSSGSLVTMHWGYDIASYIMKAANTPTTIVFIDNIDIGVRAEFIEVIISYKF